jgi:hypothetical protein
MGPGALAPALFMNCSIEREELQNMAPLLLNSFSVSKFETALCYSDVVQCRYNDR